MLQNSEYNKKVIEIAKKEQEQRPKVNVAALEKALKEKNKIIADNKTIHK